MLESNCQPIDNAIVSAIHQYDATRTGGDEGTDGLYLVTYLEGILNPAEGRGIAALVGMDVADQAEVRALEEAELLLDGLARRQLGSGQGRELLTCYLCLVVSSS